MTTLRVLGVDPGFASMGVAVLEQSAGRVRALAADVLRTQKAPRKALRDLRVASDDLRRLRVFWDGLAALAKAHAPQVLAVETYAPQPGRAGRNGWKAALTYGLVVGFGFAHGLSVMPFTPSDLKRQLARKAGASKQDVAEVVFGQVDDLEPLLRHLPASQHEHATDAAGHAVLGMREMVTLRRMMGVAVP